MKRLLVSIAHPDDESFACGGTIAKYAAAGWHVEIISATNGDAGRDAVSGRTGGELGDARIRELRRAATILGAHNVHFLNYPDGRLKELPEGELEGKIRAIMDNFRPDVVITFETGGITNHPDHIRMSYATTYAFQKYAKGHPEEPEPKLYYMCIPASVISYLHKMKFLPPESYGKPISGVDDKLVMTVIDISRQKAKKLRALMAHESQAEDVEKIKSVAVWPQWKQEYYMLRMVGTHEAFMGKYDRVSNSL